MLLQDKRVFIVEDQLANRAIVQLLLERAGASTAFERWGTETIEKLAAFEPVDVILLDLMFPNGVTGYDVYDEIRKQPQFKQTPIVAISATDPSAAIPRVKAQGFAGFIPKPVDFDRFPNQIAIILEGETLYLDE